MKYIELKNGIKYSIDSAYNGDFLDLCKEIPDKSIDIIMADPPYYKVKGKFDFKWKCFNSYLRDVEKWAAECSRVLKDTGTLFWWGHAKKIAYSQIILDKHFKLQNSLIWEKTDCQTRKNKLENQRSFIPVTERVLFYSKQDKKTGLERVYEDPECFRSIKDYMKKERSSLMAERGFKNVKEFNVFIQRLTGKSSVVDRHYFANSQWVFPTLEIYQKLQKTGYFQKPFDELKHEYDVLKSDYEKLIEEYEAERRYFDLKIHGLTDVIRHAQDVNRSKNFDHETVKPLGLILQLIETTARPGDLCLIPFLGTFTDAEACHKLGVKWIGSEIDKDNFNEGLKEYTLNTKQMNFEF